MFTAGTTGALILTYCIYYDMKRRTDPEYKRKVHERRCQSKQNKLRYFDADSDDYADSEMEDFDINDLDIQFSSVNLFNTIDQNDQFSTGGNVAEGLCYLANAILMCTQPEPMAQRLHESLPKSLLMPLMHQLSEVQIMDNDNDSSSVHSNTSVIKLESLWTALDSDLSAAFSVV